MTAMRDALEAAIVTANKAKADGKPVGSRGLVYIADWRLNPLRDLSTGNAWTTNNWNTVSWTSENVAHDQTIIGLLLRAIAAGITVRVLVWMPYLVEYFIDKSHPQEHVWLAQAVANANSHAESGVADLAVVGLDSRVAPHPAAAHHQKMCVIRAATGYGADPVAFCGGVDFAFTRRDAPEPGAQPSHGFMAGDWQSGSPPAIAVGWPQGPSSDPAVYPTKDVAPTPSASPGNDLFPDVYGDGASHRQIWHDQHLMLQGPVVATLQNQFCERWNDGGVSEVLPSSLLTTAGRWVWPRGFLYTSSATSVLPAAEDISEIGDGTATVQMWRTIPLREDRDTVAPSTATIGSSPSPMFTRGEFTVLSGYVHAAQQASNLIWIFDQYFWSVPYCRMLNTLVKQKSNLAVIVVLPPHADSSIKEVLRAQHRARLDALQALTSGLDQELPRVVSVNLWDYRNAPSKTWGIYCHAKAHTYDGTLFVCGSANINRRSLTGDSELALAVYDPTTVAAHVRALWSGLFPGLAWPTYKDGTPIDLSADPTTTPEPPGPAFAAQFASAVVAADSNTASYGYFVTSEKAVANPKGYTLPNGVLRDADISWPVQGAVYDDGLESTSLKLRAESIPVDVGLGEPGLDDVARRIEASGLAGTWWRARR
jgi:phosphatidylserine/phosphatidylglycerophosphate/cardiolipin synthase-like enzyme